MSFLAMYSNVAANHDDASVVAYLAECYQNSCEAHIIKYLEMYEPHTHTGLFKDLFKVDAFLAMPHVMPLLLTYGNVTTGLSLCLEKVVAVYSSLDLQNTKAYGDWGMEVWNA